MLENEVLIVTDDRERRAKFISGKKIIYNEDIPKCDIDKIARILYPTILELYQSDEGQEEFRKWKEERKSKSNDNE